MIPISLTQVIWFVVYALVVAIVFGLLDYLIRTAPFVPDGWKPVLRWVLMALGILILSGILLSFTGGGPVFRP